MNSNHPLHTLEVAPHTLAVLGLGLSRLETDPIGAGNAFTSRFLSRWLEEIKPLETELSEEVLLEALTRGCALGVIATQFESDWENLPSRGELEDFVAEHEKVRR